jgi:hypothetical protein
MILTLNNRQYLLGMQWSMHPDQAEVRAKLKQAPGARFIRNNQQHGEGANGIHLGIYDGKVKGKAVSAALAIGAVEPSCVVYQRIDDETVWLCVIANGLPYSGKDVLVAPDEADKMLLEALSFCQTVVGDTSGATASVPDVLARFELNAKEGRISKKQLASLAAKNQPRVATRLLALAGIGILILALIAGFVFVKKLREKNRLNAVNMKRMMQSEAEQRKAAEQLAAAKKKFQDEVDSRRAELSSAAGTSTHRWRQWQQVRASLPLTMGGYVVTKIECAETECKVSWMGRGPFVRTMAKRELPGYVESDDISSTAITQHPIAPVTGGESPGYQSVIELRQHLVDRLEYAVPGIAIGASKVQEIKPPPDLGLATEVIGNTGPLKASFRGSAALIYANDFVNVVADMPVILRKATWAGSGHGEESVSIEAEYVYVNRQN